MCRSGVDDVPASSWVFAIKKKASVFGVGAQRLGLGIDVRASVEHE
jgi:hypothetical protein